MPDSVQFRRGTAAEWTSADPVLGAGELGYETDNKRFKIGDGTSLWSELDYVEGTGAAVFTALTDVPPSYSGQEGKVVAVKGDASGLEFVVGGGEETDPVFGASEAAEFEAGDKAKLDGIEAGADVTDAGNVSGAGAVMKSLYNAYSILMATDDDIPVAITIAAQQVIGRLTGGAIKGLSVTELLALVFSAAMTENVEIQLTAAPSADGKYSGIVEAGIAGATLAFGDLVYFQTADSRWELASADNAAAGHNLKLGICILAAANDGSATKVLLYGKVRADTAFPALTIGAPVFMSTTAGDIQVAAPTGTTDIVRKVGFGNTADELFFCPSTDFIKLV